MSVQLTAVKWTFRHRTTFYSVYYWPGMKQAAIARLEIIHGPHEEKIISSIQDVHKFTEEAAARWVLELIEKGGAS